jgi:hypothetical protein
VEAVGGGRSAGAAGPAPIDPTPFASALALAAIAAIAVWTRWWPGRLADARTFWRGDESFYWRLACRILHGKFEVDHFINPTLYAYVVAAAGAIVGGIRRLFGADASFDLFLARETAAPHLLVLAGRVVSIVASVCSVLVVARIGRRLFSPAVGLIAALMLAIDGVAATSSPLCGNESLMVLLALLACLVTFEGGSLRRRLAAGLLIGLATATKYSAGILALPLALAFGLGVAPTLLAAAAGFVLGSPMALVNFGEFVRDFRTQAGFLGAGYSAEDLVRNESGFHYYFRTFADMHEGVVSALLCAAGIVASIAVAVVRRRRSHALLLSASLPLFLYLGTGIFSMQRFLLPALPFILMHGAWLIEAVRRRVPLLRTSPNGALAVALLALLGSALPAMTRERAFLASRYVAPEPPSSVLADLEPCFAANACVAELAIPNVFRLLLPSDPWSELALPPPDPAIRSAVSRWLAERDLLPTSAPLDRFIVRSATLADLRRNLKESGVDTLLVVLPTRQLLTGFGIRPEPNDLELRACPYWTEFVEWLATLPRLCTSRSPDLRISAAVLDLREPPR